MSQNITNEESTLVQEMDWFHQAPSHTWANGDPVLCHHMASVGHNEGMIRPQWVSFQFHSSQKSQFQIYCIYAAQEVEYLLVSKKKKKKKKIGFCFFLFSFVFFHEPLTSIHS